MGLFLHIGLNARRSNAESWGDLAYARCLAQALAQQGHQSRLFFRDEAPDLSGQGDVVLRIVGPHLDEPVPGLPNLLWMISPPNLVPMVRLARYQGVFVASATLAQHCVTLGVTACYLPQATDSTVFTPQAIADQPADLRISFVGNFAPRAPRETVRAAIELGFDVKIWGQGWDGVVPSQHICGTRLEIEMLAQVYARSRIVLNSHMPYMAQLGFMSNRSFDAMACGAAVVSDPVVGFADPDLRALHQPDTPQSLADTLAHLLSAPMDRAAISDAVQSRYGFAARARTLAVAATGLLESGQIAPHAFARRPARPRGTKVVTLTVSDCPDDKTESEVPLSDHLDALIDAAQLDVTLTLSDPTSTPDGLSVDQAMIRAAIAVWRIGEVVARAASFGRLTVVPSAERQGRGVVHAMMPDHSAAQQAACQREAPEAMAVLEQVCARARRVLECPLAEIRAQAKGDDWIDPVQAQIRSMTNRPLYAHTPEGFSRDRQKRHLLLWPRKSLARTDAPIGVFVHLYYAELATVFRDRFAFLDLPYRLYVSTDTSEKASQIRADLPMADVRVLPNRGRDIFGKLYGFADGHARHDIVLHLHGKKSLHSDGLDQWLDHCLTCLLPSRDEVMRIVSLFQSVPDLGMVAPLTFRSVLAAAHWGDNKDIAQALVARMQSTIPLPDDATLDFPVGSMFWARRHALQPLLDLALAAEHFPDESGQVDATPAHAIERLFGVVCQAAGYRLIRVAPAGSNQHKAKQVVAKRNEDVRRAIDAGMFEP